jgi:hypothetical protein
VPVTTIVTQDEPTGTFVGDTDEMASGAELPPPPEEESIGAPPHPESRVRRKQKEKTRRTKRKGLTTLKFTWSAQIIRTQISGQAKNSSAESNQQNGRNQLSVFEIEKMGD